MQDNIEIRRVSADDFSALRKIYERVRKESFFWMDSREIRPEDFDRDTEGEEIWAAWQGEEAAVLSLCGSGTLYPSSVCKQDVSGTGNRNRPDPEGGGNLRASPEPEMRL